MNFGRRAETGVVFFLVVFLLGVTLLAQEPGSPSSPGGLAAIVDGEPITFYQLEKEVQRQLDLLLIPAESLEEARKSLRPRVLQGMILHKLLLHRCDQEKIDVTDEIVDLWVKDEIQRKREYGSRVRDVDEYFRSLEESTGENEEQLRATIRDELRIQRLFELHVYKDQFITPGELRSHFDAHREEFTTDDVYTVRHLLIMRDTLESELKQTIEEIEEKLKAGGAFELLVTEYSEGPLNEEGGLYTLSDKQLDSWIEPIPDVIRGLETGKVSKQVITKIGVHYFLLEKKISGQNLSFEDAQKKIRIRIAQQRRQQQLGRFEKELIEKAEIRRFLPAAK